MPISTFIKELHRVQEVGYVAFFIGVAVLLYAISAVRWGYHCTAILVLSRRNPSLTMPRPLFFLVNTTGWGFWLSIYMTALFYIIKWWDEAGRPDFTIDNQHPAQAWGLIAAFLLLGLTLQLTARNSNAGMREMYGGNRALSFFVELCGLVLLVFVACLLDYLT
jgi:hypothetical protein